MVEVPLALQFHTTLAASQLFAALGQKLEYRFIPPTKLLIVSLFTAAVTIHSGICGCHLPDQHYGRQYRQKRQIQSKPSYSAFAEFIIVPIRQAHRFAARTLRRHGFNDISPVVQNARSNWDLGTTPIPMNDYNGLIGTRSEQNQHFELRCENRCPGLFGRFKETGRTGKSIRTRHHPYCGRFDNSRTLQCRNKIHRTGTATFG